MRDWAAHSTLKLVGLGRDKWRSVPADLLGSGLLPLAPLARNRLSIDNALLHRLLLENAVNSGWIKLDL